MTRRIVIFPRFQVPENNRPLSLYSGNVENNLFSFFWILPVAEEHLVVSVRLQNDVTVPTATLKGVARRNFTSKNINEYSLIHSEC